MGKSLQDQLRALGLAKEQQKKQAAGQGGKSAKPRRKKGRPGQSPGGELSLDQAYALRQREEQKQADLARKKKQAEDRQRRQINNEIRKIVDQHRLNDAAAQIARNFMFRGRIRKIYLSPEQHKALGEGEMGIVYLSGGYHLLASEQLAAVRQISAEHLVDLDGGSEDAEDDHPVPDDLAW